MINTQTLIRWHRRIGIIACVWLFLLASTGLLLQQGHHVGLDKPLLQSPFWYRLTDTPLPTVVGNREFDIYQVDHQLITRQGNIAHLDGKLIALLASSESLLLAESNRLYLLTPVGELVDTLKTDFSIKTLGRLDGGQPGLTDTDGHHYRLDWWLESDPKRVQQRPSPVFALTAQTTVPASISAYGGISIEQVIHALHSGHAFGKWGEPLMSLVAILIIILSLGGLWLWTRRRPKVSARASPSRRSRIEPDTDRARSGFGRKIL